VLDGTRGIASLVRLAWRMSRAWLAKDGITVTDIVKVTQYLTRTEDIMAYAAVRTRLLSNHRPTSMLVVIRQLVCLELLVEVEIVAARA
jgi:2-iminobutanoate/2-iminopropanoate deaminase